MNVLADKLAVLYEDNHCLVVAKPARLLTASDHTGDETLLSWVRSYDLRQRAAEGKKGYIAPLHFLDRPVSGIVMYARTSKAAARLSAQFRAGEIEKTYHAIVEAHPLNPAGVLRDWLLKDHASNLVTVVPPNTAGAKASELSYRQLDKAGNFAWLEVRPRTGRSHQIRVQLSSRGMPIFGDRKYGASNHFNGAIALHAVAVTFAHPITKEPVNVQSSVPESWCDAWPKGRLT